MEILKCPVCQDLFTDPAHALLHQQRSALKLHTLVEVTRDPLSLKCPEHRDELKLFCSQDRVPVCCLCVLVGAHKNHKAPQLHEACDEFKTLLQRSMNQLLKRRNDAEHTIKELESFYRQTVKSAADLRERISDKYSRLHVVLDGDERLMQQIVDAEEACVTDWLDVQREKIEVEIRDIDRLRTSTKTVLQENNQLKFLQKKVKKLGIFADLHKGELLFYDADAMALIQSFPVKCQEPMFPMFNPCIDVNGVNKQPLALFCIKEPWDWCDDTQEEGEKDAELEKNE
uniref:B box-type domain-containing protein n=1 Tax=Knipowitschia caucasica TaxID=637954 RepID=A0AAV2JRR3_KNICA